MLHSADSDASDSHGYADSSSSDPYSYGDSDSYAASDPVRSNGGLREPVR